eukprot:jgi/Antlo1/1792/733
MLPKLEYARLVSRTLDVLSEKLATIPLAGEIDHHDGVLSWKVDGVGEYVFNKQTPLRQLWASSPVTGPVRFEVNAETWVDTRNRRSLSEFMESEIHEIKRRLAVQNCKRDT